MTVPVESVARLEDSLETNHARTERSLRIVAIAYLILIPAAIWDVHRVLDQIRTAGNPGTVTALAVGQMRGRTSESKPPSEQGIKTGGPQLTVRLPPLPTAPSPHRAM